MTNGEIEIRKICNDPTFQKKNESAVKQLKSYILSLNELYKQKNGEYFIRYIESRTKTPESIVYKLERKNLELSIDNMKQRLYDISGVRIICYDINQIYWIVEKLMSDKKFNIIKIKDYIEKPKKNGYESFHIILSVPVVEDKIKDYMKVELQIRTIVMDAWASLDTRIRYKKKNKISDAIESHMEKYAKISRQLDKMILKIIKDIK